MISCIRIVRRIIPPTGGAWIPYTAAQVAARRAAQMVVIMICATMPSPADAPRPCDCHPSWYPPAWPRTEPLPFARAIDVPEPGTLGVLAVAVVGLWAARRWA